MSFFERLLLGYLGYTLPRDLSFFQRTALAYLGYTAGGNVLQNLSGPPPRSEDQDTDTQWKYAIRGGRIVHLRPDGTWF